jgi:DNA polymerase III epsilon subunit-like protein
MKDQNLDKILFLDLETTGTLPEAHNILSVGCAIWRPDREVKQRDTFEVYLQPNNKFWLVDVKALEYNKYDLIEHTKKAVDFKKGLESFLVFLESRMDFPIVCAGINVKFDIDFLTGFIRHPSKGALFSYRVIDLTSILISMYHKKLVPIPDDYESPTKWAFEFFGLTPQHDGPKSPLKDVLAEIKLYERLLQLK